MVFLFTAFRLNGGAPPLTAEQQCRDFKFILPETYFRPMFIIHMKGPEILSHPTHHAGKLASGEIPG